MHDKRHIKSVISRENIGDYAESDVRGVIESNITSALEDALNQSNQLSKQISMKVSEISITSSDSMQNQWERSCTLKK